MPGFFLDLHRTAGRGRGVELSDKFGQVTRLPLAGPRPEIQVRWPAAGRGTISQAYCAFRLKRLMPHMKSFAVKFFLFAGSIMCDGSIFPVGLLALSSSAKKLILPFSPNEA